MVLQLANLGDVGGHFHNVGDLPGTVAKRGRPNQHIVILTGSGGDHHLGLVGLPVFKCFGHRAVGARLIPVFVYLMAASAQFGIEIFFKASVGGRQSKLSVLYRYITGHFIEKLLVTLLGAVQFFPQSPDFGNIGRYLHDQFHITVLIANRCGVHDHRCLITFGGLNGRFRSQARAGFKCLFSRADEAGTAFHRINIPAIAADPISQTFLIEFVYRNNLKDV